MRMTCLFASEISHSVLRQQSTGSAEGKTAAKNVPTADKGLHLIHEIWQAVN
jgi:hypothetical protein